MVDLPSRRTGFLIVIVLVSATTVIKISIKSETNTNISNINDRTNVSPAINQSHSASASHLKRRQVSNKTTPKIDLGVVKLVKCRQATFFQENLVVPESLRVPHPPQVLEELIQSFGMDFYNFSLRNLTEEETVEWRVGGKGVKNLKLNLYFKNNYTSRISKANKNSTVHLYTQTLHYFTPFGFLKRNQTNLHPNNFCISNITKDSISVELKPLENLVGLPKCCPMGMVVQFNSNDSTARFNCSFVSTSVYTPKLYETSEKFSSLNFNYKPISQKKCVDRALTVPWTEGEQSERLQHQKIRILNNGDVLTLVSGNHNWKKLQEGTFCLDGLFDSSKYDQFKNLEQQQIIQQCPLIATELERVVSLVHLISYCISFVFFLLILAFYGLIWKNQNVHGWTTMAFSFCGLINSLCIVVGHTFGLMNFPLIRYNSSDCIAVGILSHFFNMSFFSWMTILNYDLLATIRSMTPKAERSKGKRRFLIYFLIGFGIPGICVSISSMIDQNFGFFDDRVIRPQYGRERCFVDKSAALMHVSIPNTILFICNTIFAILTLKTLWDFKKGTKIVQNFQSTKKIQSRFSLFGKLCILMGFSWTFEMLSNLLENQSEHLIWIWLIFDSYNGIQVICLFWIFVCKKEVKIELSKRYPIFGVGFTFARMTVSRWTSKEPRSTIALRVTNSKQTPSKS